MSDFDLSNKVAQTNELIRQAHWELDGVSLKIFKTLISCIDVFNPPKDNKVYISKKELFDLIGSESDGGYDYLKRKTRALQQTSIKIDTPTAELYVPLVNKIHWSKNEDEIWCRFDEDFMPYVIEMHALFLQYEVGNIRKIDTKYGLILYEYLLSMARQEQAITEEPKYEYTIPMKRLRALTGTEKKYKLFKDFENKVLRNAEKDINTAGIEFLMRYVKNKPGRAVESITFKLRVRTSILEEKFMEIKNPNLMDQPI